MGEKTTKPLERRQMKFDKRSSTISSERGIMQISIAAALTTSIATTTFVTAFLTSAPILTVVPAAGQTMPSLGKASNNNTSSSAAIVGTPAITSNTFPTLGNPSVVYMESDKSSAPRPVSINGTHAQAVAFTGNGTLAGTPVIDTGTAYLVTRSDGSIYTFGNGAIVSKTGNGTLIYTFDAIGHYLQDGKLHDTGHVIIKSTLRNLASFSDKIGLYKDWYDKSGNGMTTMWFWKG
jgi:hypothetical protein